jgi:plastocyanin
MMRDSDETPDAAKITRRSLLRWMGIGLLAAPVIGLVGCTTARENSQYVIKIQPGGHQSAYSPAEITVPKGSTVTWQNIAAYPQTVTCDPAKAGSFPDVYLPKDAKPFDSGELYPGQTWAYVFNIPGDYLYFSRYSQTASVVGMVHVAA